MGQKEQIKLFEQKRVRSVWDEEKEEWFFSVIDVVEVLTDSTNPTDYLKKMRKRDPELGIYIGTNCPQVAMQTESGKLRKTLAASTEQLLRIVQSSDIAQVRQPQGFAESAQTAQEGAQTAKAARLQLEKSTGRKVVSKLNAKQLGTGHGNEGGAVPDASHTAATKPKESNS